VAKWLLVGRLHPGNHPLWSSLVWRNELADSFVEVVAAPWFARPASGTWILNVWLRAMGARIGRGVWCESYWLPEADLIDLCLQRGISVAAINYRYSTIAPYPAPFMDGGRAVQYLRLHAAEFNLDKRAFGATGRSAVSGISLWLGFHDDLANPASKDPVERESTRLSAMAVRIGQSTYDPRTIAKLIDDTAHIEALQQLFDVKSGDPLNAIEAFQRYEDGSAVTHLTRDDPPVFMEYAQNNTPMPPSSTGNGIHHPRFGYYFKERMDKLASSASSK